MVQWPSISQVRIHPRYNSFGLFFDLAYPCATFQIDALILENTFTSLPELVPHALPVLSPFAFLCHQKWDSASKIPFIPATTPILMLSSVRDEIVPKAHMHALWEAVAKRGEKNLKTVNGSESKVGLERAKYIEFEYGTHSEFIIIPLLRLPVCRKLIYVFVTCLQKILISLLFC